MAASARYRALKRGVLMLRKALLPKKFDPTGSYRGAENVHLRAISFRILVHAEIEHFVEDRAYELFDAGWQAWNIHNAPNRVILALLAYSEIVTFAPPSKLGGDPANKKAYDEIGPPTQKAQKVWRAAHKDNHGVKEANVLRLLLPLGIAADDLDNTLLADLTSFGSSRGAVAHKSSVGVMAYADPKTELDQANQLVVDLKALDELITNGLKQVNKSKKALTQS